MGALRSLGFVALVSVFASLVPLAACRTVPGRDVRYEPTPMPVVRAMLELAAVGPQDVVYDLGSGDGRIPIMAAKEFGARATGVEIDPVLIARAQANAHDAAVSDRVEFELGDMCAADLRRATVVTLFLHPQPNIKLRPKLLAQLPPGARVVSYMWHMGDWDPEAFRRIGRHKVFLWRVPRTVQPGGVEAGTVDKFQGASGADRLSLDADEQRRRHRDSPGVAEHRGTDRV